MYQTVLDFWFKELTPQQWWVKDSNVDRVIQQRFGLIHDQAVQGALFEWRKTIEGRLAEIIVLDQFSRNIYRDLPLSFAFDGIALVLAQEAVNNNQHVSLLPVERSFLYMPYMHSESLVIHEIAVALFSEKEMESNYQFELQHKAIIERFGRYPHRNAILGRDSTDEELMFLKEPNSSF